MPTNATSKLPPVPVVCSELLGTAAWTHCTRLAVTQEARVVVIVDVDCLVQVIPPPDVDVFIAIDEDPVDLGPNRMPYVSCPLTTDAFRVPKRFLPGQTIVLATQKGSGVCALFVERIAGVT